VRTNSLFLSYPDPTQGKLSSTDATEEGGVVCLFLLDTNSSILAHGSCWLADHQNTVYDKKSDKIKIKIKEDQNKGGSPSLQVKGMNEPVGRRQSRDPG